MKKQEEEEEEEKKKRGGGQNPNPKPKIETNNLKNLLLVGIVRVSWVRLRVGEREGETQGRVTVLLGEIGSADDGGLGFVSASE